MHPINIMVIVLFVGLIIAFVWQVADWVRRDPLRIAADDETSLAEPLVTQTSLQTTPATLPQARERKSPPRQRQRGRFHYARPAYRGGKKK